MKTKVPNGSKPGQYISSVLKNTKLNQRYFLLTLMRPVQFSDPMPGSFLHVGVPRTGRFFLRRPFSVFDCDVKSITLLIVEKGEGTHLLRQLSADSQLDFIGPLGNSFPDFEGKRILAVAGGVGLAPLYHYGVTKKRDWKTDYRLAYGGRTEEDLFLGEIDLEERGAALATEDGSYGYSGNVVELARKMAGEDRPDVIISCGPSRMLRGVSALASELGVDHYVSLENRMACAMGACRACVIQIRTSNGNENRTVCHDGPVFDANTVDWDTLPEP